MECVTGASGPAQGGSKVGKMTCSELLEFNFGGLLGNGKITWARGHCLEFKTVFAFRDRPDGFFNLLKAAWESISGVSGKDQGGPKVEKKNVLRIG